MAIRPRFNRNDIFIVAKPTRLSSKTVLLPGDEISLGDYRLRQLKRWFRKRRIAKSGSEWAANLIAKWDAKAAPEVVEEVEEITIEKAGSWFTVSRGDEDLVKLQGQTALDEWLEENGHPPHDDDGED